MGSKKKKRTYTRGGPPPPPPGDETTEKLLTPELVAELAGRDGGDTSNLVTLPKKTTKRVEATQRRNTPVRVNKAKQRRLAKLKEKHEKRIQRGSLMESLQHSNLNAEQLRFMHSSARLGQKETTRQQLSRAMAERRAGLPQSVDVELEHPVIRNDEKEEFNQVEDLPVSPHAPEQGDTKICRTAGGVTFTLRKREQKRKRGGVVEVIEHDQHSSDDESEDESEREEERKSGEEEEEREEEKEEREEEKEQQQQEKEQQQQQEKEQQQQQEKEQQQQEKEQQQQEKEQQQQEKNERPQAFFVPVVRDPTIQAVREKLPIYMEEQVVMEAIAEHPVTIICGETGSGKTTQVPQFLFEAGYSHPDSKHPGMIGVTQPRRVAAMSMARRVAEEMNIAFGQEVSFQVRYQANISPTTRIKYMTDGILLREIQSDFLLRRYSVIVLDEAHERNLNTDVLIGLLSRIIKLRREIAEEEMKKATPDRYRASVLKLVIMSATLRVEDFTTNPKLFHPPPPVVNITTRQYPVTIHFNRRTPIDDYLSETFRKVCRLHRKLPPGGVLVFLTGQGEIEHLCRKLRHEFNSSRSKRKKSSAINLSADVEDDRVEGVDVGEEGEAEEETVKEFLDNRKGLDRASELAMEETLIESSEEEDTRVLNRASFLISESDAAEKMDTRTTMETDSATIAKEEDETEHDVAPVHVLPLYSMLPAAQQLRVFQPPPEGARVIVVATNVAETSLTIPNIRYVVDAGLHKERVYDLRTGLSAFEINWISKASADQRAGRSGRTGPGHCYRLYSSAVFERHFPRFAEPEIARMPVEHIVLQMKSMSIDNVLGFPFPTPPDGEGLRASAKILVLLGALSDGTHKLTPLGRTMAAFPVSPRLAKMLVLARQGGCLPYVIAIVAAQSVGDVFVRTHQRANDDDDDDDDKKKKKKKEEEEEEEEGTKMRANKGTKEFEHNHSDLLTALRAIGAYEYEGGNAAFCMRNRLHFKSMQEISKLRRQLTSIVNSLSEGPPLPYERRMIPPTPTQEMLIRQIIAAAFLDQIARRVDREQAVIKTRAEYEPFSPDLPRTYIHSTSSAARRGPPLVAYTEMIHSKRPYMKGVTAVSASWLVSLGPALCSHLDKPLENPAPFYDPVKDSVRCYVRPRFGPHSWELPVTEMAFPETVDRFKYFARFFLEGLVCPQMKELQNCLSARPAGLTKSWLQPRITALIQPLIDFNIDTRHKLLLRWDVDKTFLLLAVLQWVQRKFHTHVRALWPPTRLDPTSTPPETRPPPSDDEGSASSTDLEEYG